MIAAARGSLISFPFFIPSTIRVQHGVIALCLLLILSCSPVMTSLPQYSEELHPPADALWKKLNRSKQSPETLRAIARIEVSSKGRKYPLKIALMLKQPALIRIESIPLFGATDFFLSLNNTALKVFIPEKNTFYVGQPSRVNLAAFFPINLPPKDLVSVMMGIPPTGEHIVKFEKDANAEEYRLTREMDEHGRQILLLSFDHDHLKTITFLAPGEEILYRVTYDDYQHHQGIEIPYYITLHATENDTTAVVRYADLELSNDDDSLFDLPLPEGIAPTLLDRKGGSFRDE